MARTVTFKGSPLHLAGRPVKTGMRSSGFKVTGTDLKETRLSDFEGKVKILTSFPSIDTPVCDMQVKAFNKEASGFDKSVVVAGISMDLPFAYSRFCQANDITAVKTFSDYRYASFGINYGLFVKELGLLARSVVIVDTQEIVRYVQIVPELTHQPDYADALKALQQVLDTPAGPVPADERSGHCVPCEGAVAALAQEKVRQLLAEYRGWEVVDGARIRKEFRFKDFSDAKFFLDLIAAVAEIEGHHPSVFLSWGTVKVTLSTHAAQGLTDNDFIMAGIIDELAS